MSIILIIIKIHNNNNNNNFYSTNLDVNMIKYALHFISLGCLIEEFFFAFLTKFILTRPVNFPVNANRSELFSHKYVARIEPTTSEVKGVRSDKFPESKPSFQNYVLSIKLQESTISSA